MKDYELSTMIITILNYLFALRNFQDPRKNTLKFICCCIYQISLVSTYTIFAYIINTANIISSPYNVERIMYTILYYVIIVGYIFLVTLGLYHSKNVLKLRKQIDKVDEQLKSISDESWYRRSFLHERITSFFWFLLTALLFGLYFKWIISHHERIEEYYSATSFLFVVNIGSITLNDFKMHVYWLEHRFKQTNEHLDAFLFDGKTKTKKSNEEIIFRPSYNFPSKFQSDIWLPDPLHAFREPFLIQTANSELGSRKNSSQVVKKIHSLHRIRFVHLQLCQVSKMLNKIFDTQLLLYSFVVMVYTTICIYYTYSTLRKKEMAVIAARKLAIMVYVFNGLLAFMKIIAVSHSCEYTTKEANKTIEIIHSSSLYETDPELRDQILQFSLQISLTQLGASKSTEYKLNYNFVRKCLNYMLSYLVIMIQWCQTT